MEKGNTGLYRSEKNRIIAGVCGGLGEYFDVDPVLIRLAFVLFVLAGGSGVLIYIVLWIVIPTQSSFGNSDKDVVKENASEIKVKTEKVVKEVSEYTKKYDSDKLIGLFMVTIGTLFLFGMFWDWVWSFFFKLWPLVIIVPGFYILFKNKD